MIGRFLLGAGLGALVGTGVLALISIMAPGPRALPGSEPALSAPASAPEPTATPMPEAAPAAPVGPSPAPTAEPSTVPAADGEGPDAAPSSAGEPSAPTRAPAVQPDPTTEPGQPEAPQPIPDDAKPTPVPDDQAALAPEPPLAEGAVPVAPSAPALAEAPAQPAASAPPVPPNPPTELSPPGKEAAPEPLAQPAEAPATGAAMAIAPPETLAPPAPGEGAVTAPVPEPAPVVLPDPASRALAEPSPAGDAAPDAAVPPGLPPLTPEEEAMLAQIAKDGPDAVLPPDQNGEAVDETPGPAPEIVVPDGAPAPPSAGDVGRIVVGEGTTLPSVPSLIDSGKEQAADKAGADGIVSDRLPRIGDEAGAEAAPDVRPVARNARAFDNPTGKPLFAVILIDDGDPALDRAALAKLPFPVSFALDPLAAGAAERAEIYRAADQEVLMLASGLPKGAAASDVEVAFQSMQQALPQAVAVLDPPDRVFQNDRGMASLVVPVIGAEGLGLVTWDQGLNAADQVARRAEIPATVAFRALDAEGEAAPVIRRYLDRAAFKAAQEGHVTVIGHARPETVAALLEWTVEGRAGTVALAPVTAVMAQP